MCCCVLHKALSHENSKMRFLWAHNNGKNRLHKMWLTLVIFDHYERDTY